MSKTHEFSQDNPLHHSWQSRMAGIIYSCSGFAMTVWVPQLGRQQVPERPYQEWGKLRSDDIRTGIYIPAEIARLGSLSQFQFHIALMIQEPNCSKP